jgi:murein DD-endopeptidase MepM/ murein hydrolase activator NlpD
MKRKNIILLLSVVVLSMVLTLVVLYYGAMPEDTASEFDHAPVVKTSVNRLYGLAADSFDVKPGRIGRNQNLGQILEQFNLPERSLAQLVQYAGNVFDMRKIRVGNKYTAFVSKDSLSKLEYLVYEHSPVDFVVFDFRDSLKVSLKQKEVTTVEKRAYGEINTSLWDAIKKSSINPLVALQLSEIYAWTIDFFGLQPGDHFTVVYDELFVDSVSIGLGEIHGASFNHGGRDLLAIPFKQGNSTGFFDAEGNSLRRAFLKAPLRFSHITSHFSNSRFHPILKIYRPHHGVDYAAPIGTPVYSIGDGTVLTCSYNGGEGRMVKVRHNGVYTTTYMHLSGFAKGISAEKYVTQGQIIGYVGSTGLSTGPHLDFRVYKNGTPIDPLKMESPSVDPVKPENKLAFDEVKNSTLQILTVGPEVQTAQTLNLGELEQHLIVKPLMVVK